MEERVQGAVGLDKMNQAFDHALTAHQEGRLEEAESLYAQILDTNSAHFKTLHMFGVLRLQQGRNAEAIALIGDALKIDPNEANALMHYGAAFHAARRFEEALASYDKALKIRPDYVNAIINRGNVLRDLNRPLEALVSYEVALSVQPSVYAFYNRGVVFQGLNRFTEALASYDQTLAEQPDHVEALYNRGIVLHELKRPLEALESFDHVLALRPGFMEAHNNRGTSLQDLKRYEDALASYDRALALDPSNIEAITNRGISLKDLRRPEEAMMCFDRVIALKPDFAAAFVNYGLLMIEQKRMEDAVTCYDRALIIEPDNVEAIFNRGTALFWLNRYEESLASFERTLIADPNHLYALGAAANVALNNCNWPQIEKYAAAIKQTSALSKPVIPPLVMLAYGGDAAQQLECAKNYVHDKIRIRPSSLWNGTVYRHGKIRIAYLSSDFREHPVAYQIVELLERHDRSRFEVFGFSLGEGDGSEIRARIVKAVDQFHDLHRMSDANAAKLLKELEIDITVDLGGHTRDARSDILSYKPCPIQVNYLGYPGTMGADFIDYVIGDNIVLPFDQQPFFTEKIVHLPDSYMVGDSKRTIGMTPTRKEAGLPEQGFVFCCFNNSWKITAPIFEIWLRLLSAVPSSVLWLKDANEITKNNLWADVAARGINPQHLIFAAHVKLEEHLARYRLADLFLDTLPYNAHATASDALWVGLPLVTCIGESFASRVAASLLNTIGLPELVTNSLEAYEALALKLARDPMLLQSLRQKLADNRLSTPLFNADLFRRNIESAYTRMWEISQRGETPRSFSVEPSL